MMKFFKADSNNNKKKKIDPVLAGMIVGTGIALCLGLFSTGVMNVSESAAMQIKVPERFFLESEIAQRNDELAQLEEEAKVATDDTDAKMRVELKDEEIRDLEAEMARIDNGSYVQWKRRVIISNLKWFISGLAVLIVTIVLAKWMRQNCYEETRQTT